MRTRTKVMLWLLVILILTFSLLYLISNYFQRDRCATAFQKGEGQCCYGVGSCKNCFFVNPVKINDEKCRNSTECYTNPMIEQHNALVDSLTCECGYYNSNMSTKAIEKDIERLYKIITGEEKDVGIICTVEISKMVKYKY